MTPKMAAQQLGDVSPTVRNAALSIRGRDMPGDRHRDDDWRNSSVGAWLFGSPGSRIRGSGSGSDLSDRLDASCFMAPDGKSQKADQLTGDIQARLLAARSTWIR